VAAAQGACKDAPKSSGSIPNQPWQQAWFDAPAKIWPFSTGVGMTVAVIDAGVDPTNPQLAGKVAAGYDFVNNRAQGDIDCVPHGTAEAGIIAATKQDNIGFYGLAPDAKIMPIRVSKDAVTDNQSKPVNPTALAKGISYAVDHGANVIDCAVVSYQPNDAVAAAVKRAVSKGVVVVAMVGDSHNQKQDGILPNDDPPPFPAMDDDVIGVGAVDQNGRRVDNSQIGPYVDVVAPGADVIADAIGGQDSFDGTSIASAFVAATAALLLSERPSPFVGKSGRALVQAVTHQILGTASPELTAQGGLQRLAYGAGLVDPFRALTENPSNRGPVALPAHTAPPPPPRNPAKEAAQKDRRHTNHLAVLLAEGVGAATILLLALVIVLPRGRPRRWRPARTESPAAATDDAPEFVSGEELFRDPATRE
jgi:type VII secretion-associated serine protease mycosin